MHELKRLLKEVQQKLDEQMEKAYIVYRRKDLILAMKYFKRLAEKYKETPEMYMRYKGSEIMLMDVIYHPEAIVRFCKYELERQEEENNAS